MTPYEWFRRFAARFSESPMSVGYSFGAFVFFVNVRNMVEFWILGQAASVDKLIHYNLYYFSLGLALALWLHVMTGRGMVSMLKLVLPGFIVTFVPPLLDATVYAHIFMEYDYLPANSWEELGHAYLTWFGPFGRHGVTAGMRTEIALVTATSFFYVHAVTGKLGRAVLTGIGTYTIIFVSLAVPPILYLSASDAGMSWSLQVYDYGRVLALGTGLLLVACFARAEPALFRSLVRDARPLRILHYLLMFVLGLVARPEPVSWNEAAVWVRIVPAGLAVAFVWVFAVMNNNVYDLEIDRINAPERPLVTGEVGLAKYERLSWSVGALALAFAGTAGAPAFLFVLIFAAAYFTYSTPPLRLKVKCFVSKWVIGLNSMACLMMGYALDSERLDAPGLVGWVVLLWFSLGSHMIDLKDIEGDKAAGIRNVSTILGAERAKKLIGGAALVVHVLVGVVLGFNWLGGIIAAIGVAQFVVINRRAYSEVPVLLLQNAVSLAVVVYVATHPLAP